MAEIETDGERCGPCAQRRAFSAMVRTIATTRPVKAQACRLFGGLIREGKRIDACLRAQVDLVDMADEEARDTVPPAAELAS